MEKAVKEVVGVSKDQTLLLVKGIILGMGMIIPGISGGTIIMAFGMYEKMLEDLLKFRITPYITIGLGALLGVFTGSFVFSYLFEFHRNPTSAFILGCLLMSIPFILKRSKGYAKIDVSLFVVGGVLSFILMSMPTLLEGGALSGGQTFLAGFISSSTMMIPGVSGSAMLIILGAYEEVLLMINELQLINLAIFMAGAIAGVFILAKVLKALFASHESKILFFFSGLILGSSRILFPSELDLLTVIAFVLGVGLVYKWGNFKYRSNNPFLARTYGSVKSFFNKAA
jgi:putative membrane protein